MIIQRETNMTPGISKKHLLSLSFVGATMPPRDPTITRMKRMRKTARRGRHREPAVIREPDED